MTLDLVALFAVGLFAVWGALTGFARQVAQAVGAVAAMVAAAPAGRFFAALLASALGTSLTVGLVAATILSFLAIYALVKLVLWLLLKWLLTGKDPKNRSADRMLGFGLSGLKAAAAIWVGLSAATFLENNLVLAGRKYTWIPHDSKLADLSRRHNLIEILQFSGANNLVAAAKRASEPKSASRLGNDPDYGALMKDPRFRQLVQSAGWKKALESGDVRALMQNDQLVELIHDPKMARHLERLAEQPP